MKDSKYDSYDKNDMKGKVNEINKVGGILAKAAPKKGKTITTEKFHLVANACEDDNFSRKVPEKRDYVNLGEGVHKQNFAACKSLCNLQELSTTFKEKHPNAKF